MPSGGALMKHPTPQITTRIVGFTDREWLLIRQTAAALKASGANIATLILPNRPELYRLQRHGGGFELRLTTEEEVLRGMTGQCDCQEDRA